LKDGVVEFRAALVTEYTPGAAIGWHRDRPHYGDVIGVSRLAPCTFRMRRKRDGGWERAALRLDPRSIYLMRGPHATNGSIASRRWRSFAIR
jgi:alkylated DNA repair dioxygenase AlkB